MKKKPKDSKIENSKHILDMSKNVQKADHKKWIKRLRRIDVLRMSFYERKDNPQIARILGYNEKTIRRDLKYLQELFDEQFSAIDVKRVLQDNIVTKNQIRKDLTNTLERLRTADNGDLDSVQVAALRAEIQGLKVMDEVLMKQIVALQELGFVSKPDENINLTQKDAEFSDRLSQLLSPDQTMFLKKREDAKRKRRSIQTPKV